MIRSILITNIHDTADATVSLYINNSDDGKVYYIIHTVAVPADTSLLLDDSTIFSFDNSTQGYGLYATVAASDTVDILIN